MSLLRGLHYRPLLTAACLSLLMLVMQLLPVSLREQLYLRGDSPLQLWRWLTTHFVHINWPHLWLNLLSFWAALAVLPQLLRPRLLLTSLLFSCLCVSAGQLLWDLQQGWVAGFSGVLYGLLVSGALLAIGKNQLAPWVLLFVVVKIGREQWLGALPSSEQLLGGSVAINAHLYGALSGVLFYLGLWLSVRMRSQ